LRDFQNTKNINIIDGKEFVNASTMNGEGSAMKESRVFQMLSRVSQQQAEERARGERGPPKVVTFTKPKKQPDWLVRIKRRQKKQKQRASAPVVLDSVEEESKAPQHDTSEGASVQAHMPTRTPKKKGYKQWTGAVKDRIIKKYNEFHRKNRRKAMDRVIEWCQASGHGVLTRTTLLYWLKKENHAAAARVLTICVILTL
jgi:hypothetical protein